MVFCPPVYFPRFQHPTPPIIDSPADIFSRGKDLEIPGWFATNASGGQKRKGGGGFCGGGFWGG